ncbi:MAG: hydrolase [Thermoplasmata archaeon]
MNWIVLDVDGVLIDVSRSYDMATKLTVEYFLSKAGIDKKVDLKVIDELRRKGAFGDDYNLSEALLSAGDDADEIPAGATIQWVRDRFGTTVPADDIKRVFDTYYLGEMCQEPLFEFDGFWEREEMIIDLSLLKKIEKRFKIGVVTGRSALEMQLAERIMDYEFTRKVTSDDYLKPDPRALAVLVDDGRGVFIGDSKTDELLVETYNDEYPGEFDFIMVKRDVEDVNEAIMSLL